MKTFGKLAYEAYCKEKQWASTWESLPTEEKVSWECAGRAVLDFLLDQQTKPCCHHVHD